MKILLGTHYLAKTGGTENYTYALAMELKRLGHDVEHFGIVRGKVSSLLEEQGIPFMSANHYDLILANHNTVVEKLWPYGYIIQTCHGTIPELEQPSPFADAFVGVSEEVKEHLRSQGFEATVIPNGIDCKRFYPKKPVSQTLTTVLSLCQSDIANDFIRKCCEQANVKFLHCNKYQNNVWSIEDVINQSDLVVGLGRSAYDAMACGRAVLVYDYSEKYMSEFLGEGMLTPENIEKSMSCNCTGKASRIKYDEQSFIAEMQKYSPDLAVWSREYALENLNIEVAAKKYLAVYESLSDYKQEFGRLKTRMFKASNLLFGEREKFNEKIAFLKAKRAKHKKDTRLLVIICCVLLVVNILLLTYIFCK